ncbi:MAG: hypothetical protein U5L46_02660 [Agrobacterium sp.]|nr:hypothetical protein [Agrobacterium sp.]
MPHVQVPFSVFAADNGGVCAARLLACGTDKGLAGFNDDINVMPACDGIVRAFEACAIDGIATIAQRRRSFCACSPIFFFMRPAQFATVER